MKEGKMKARVTRVASALLASTMVIPLASALTEMPGSSSKTVVRAAGDFAKTIWLIAAYEENSRTSGFVVSENGGYSSILCSMKAFSGLCSATQLRGENCPSPPIFTIVLYHLHNMSETDQKLTQRFLVKEKMCDNTYTCICIFIYMYMRYRDIQALFIEWE